MSMNRDFARFVAVGGGVGVVSAGVLGLAASVVPWAVANAVVTVASTLLCTELHARFTFATGRRAGRREHCQAAGSALAAYLVTCLATAVLHALRPEAGALTEQAVYLGASALAGVGRFLVLRCWTFAAGRPRSATRPAAAPAVAAVPDGTVPVLAA